MSAAERVRETRELCDELYWGSSCVSKSVSKTRLDAYAAAVRAETLAEVREAVEGMDRSDFIDMDDFGITPDGQWIDRAEVLATLSKLEAPDAD